MIYAHNLEFKLLKCGGMEFQKLFFEIMKNTYGDDFIMPKPQGSYGDRKNDGYIPSKKRYYAVYGPETATVKAYATSQKLEKDLLGLLKNIESGEWIHELQEFVFVVNTRIDDIFPVEVTQKRELLEANNNVKVTLWSSYDLKILFSELTEAQQRLVLNDAYVSTENFTINMKVLNSIIDSISNMNLEKRKIDGFLEFEEKIIFNKLTDERAGDLLAASFSVNSLDKYLDDYDSTGRVKEDIGKFLKTLYEESKKTTDNSNQTFDYIREKLLTVDIEEMEDVLLKSARETIIVLMSKYFENCTIFEKTKKEKQ